MGIEKELILCRGLLLAWTLQRRQNEKLETLAEMIFRRA